jgi:pectin methylesterase-like acyl-CoA thioesterase
MKCWIGIMAALLATLSWGQGRTRLSGPVPTFTVGLPQPELPVPAPAQPPRGSKKSRPDPLAGEKLIADFGSIQDAVNAAPEYGAIIRIRPGVYREVVHVDKPGIQLRGEGNDPAKVVLVYANGAANTCGTFCSATLFVTGDDFFADGLTIANDWGKTGRPRTQAVALEITGDRAVLHNVRLLGEQDTLMAGSKKCASGQTCPASRQYFDHCYIEGEVDFIFGNAKAVFENCELRSVAHPSGGYITAQSRQASEDSGYVFDHCRLTANDGAGKVYLGRPWRDDSTVVYLHTEMGSHIQPEGWAEWGKIGSSTGPTNRLKTATYAEFESTGPGANPEKREPFSRQLTAEQAKGYEPDVFLRGSDGWEPKKIK